MARRVATASGCIDQCYRKLSVRGCIHVLYLSRPCIFLGRIRLIFEVLCQAARNQLVNISQGSVAAGTICGNDCFIANLSAK